MRPPALAGDHARHPDSPAEQAGELLQWRRSPRARRRRGPPPTTTRAVASDTPALGPADSTARTGRSSPLIAGSWIWTGPRQPAGASAGGHGVGGHGEQRGRRVAAWRPRAGCPPSAAGQCMPGDRANRRHPGHPWARRAGWRRIRRPQAAETQFAAIGCPVIAPRWASTSLPRSVPAATTAPARTTPRAGPPAHAPRPAARSREPPTRPRRRPSPRTARARGPGPSRPVPNATAADAAPAAPQKLLAPPAADCGQRAGEGQGAQRRVRHPAVRRSTRHSTVTSGHSETPSSSRTRAGTASVPVPSTSRLPRLLPGTRSRPHAQSLGAATAAGLLDGGPLRPQPAGQRRVARQVDAFLDGDHRGKRDTRRSPACRGTRGRHPRPAPRADLQVLDAGDARQAERVRHPHADLVVRRCRPPRCRTAAGRSARPSAARRRASAIAAAVAIGPHSWPPSSPGARLPRRTERERVTQLVRRLGRPEGQHRTRCRPAAR